MTMTMMIMMMIMVIRMMIMMMNVKLKYVKEGLPITALSWGLNSAPIRSDGGSYSLFFRIKHCVTIMMVRKAILKNGDPLGANFFGWMNVTASGRSCLV